MNSQATTIFIILASVVLCVVVHIVSMAVVGSFIGLRAREISFALGPSWSVTRIGRIRFRLGPLPFGGFVKFGPRIRHSPLRSWIVNLSGCVTLLAVAMVLLGPKSGLQFTVDSFRWIIEGALNPGTTGKALVNNALSAVELQSFATTLGSIASVFCAFNLIPLPPLNGGLAWLNPLKSLGLPDEAYTRIAMVGVCLLMAMYLMWFIAIIVAFVQA